VISQILISHRYPLCQTSLEQQPFKILSPLIILLGIFHLPSISDTTLRGILRWPWPRKHCMHNKRKSKKEDYARTLSTLMRRSPEDACLQRGSLGGRETEVRCKWKQNRNVSLHRNCTSKTNAISMNHEAWRSEMVFYLPWKKKIFSILASVFFVLFCCFVSSLESTLGFFTKGLKNWVSSKWNNCGPKPLNCCSSIWIPQPKLADSPSEKFLPQCSNAVSQDG